MPGALLNEKRQIINIIKHFKFEELENTVVPVFPETSWKKIRTDLIESQQRLSVLNVTKIISRLIDDHNLTNKDLKNRLSLLEVIDISRHHMKKTWYTFEMLKIKEKINFMTKSEVTTRIMEFFSEQNVSAEVYTANYDGFIFVAIKEKPKSKQRKTVRLIPICFALILGQDHFFCSKKTVTNPYIRVISNSMGYGEYKRVQLFGRNLRSLFKLLWQKRQGAINTETMEDVPYQDHKPLITSTGINFTQAIHRKQYVKNFFGPDPPQVETLALQCANSTWYDEETVEKLPNYNLCIGWNFNSTNVNNLLQNLIKEKVIQLPMPAYLSKWTTSGRNSIKLVET
ncbi:uncharacterized protein LOC127288134 [Leptopilina boulardi]|uniref:uncharacterized protein LOC127288134 n=1 Tax=Leptopilina boulardi TaxID=63433 RepID=UPI0021F61D4F|nr:uncharacterized protein LOC127288134 [Leptopilina boulardi]